MFVCMSSRCICMYVCNCVDRQMCAICVWGTLHAQICVRVDSLTRLNLSASYWGRCLNWVYRHLLWCVHPPTARYTWLYKKLPVSQCQVYWTPSLCFTFLWFYAILRVFILYSHHGYSILNEKLKNGQQIFESMSLLGALIFLSK